VVERSGASKTGEPWELRESISSPVYSYGVFENGELMAALTATLTPVGLQISQTTVVPHRRKQGCIRFILNWVVKHRGAVASDNSHTPEAKAMWRALIQMPGDLKLSMLDSETGEKRPLGRENIEEPWATQSSDVVILAEERILSESARQSRSRPSARLPVWYGPGTGTTASPNP
jgi:hypothetical protein